MDQIISTIFEKGIKLHLRIPTHEETFTEEIW